MHALQQHKQFRCLEAQSDSNSCCYASPKPFPDHVPPFLDSLISTHVIVQASNFSASSNLTVSVTPNGINQKFVQQLELEEYGGVFGPHRRYHQASFNSKYFSWVFHLRICASHRFIVPTSTSAPILSLKLLCPTMVSARDMAIHIVNVVHLHLVSITQPERI